MSFARSIADLFSKETSGATDAEVTAAISTHNTSANGHVKRGNTASRPGSPVIGDLYYNTEIKDLEEYTEDGWLIVAKQVPRVPVIGTATLGGSNNVSVSFTPSQYGQPSSLYTVQSNPGSYTATGSSSPITVLGTNLTIGTSYTFRVKSSGTYGDSSYSSYSSSITPVSLSSYESIESVTVGSGGQAIVNFTNIPSTFSHLQIRAFTIGTTHAYFTIRANNDSSSNYAWQQLSADGASVTTDAGINSSTMFCGQGSGSSTAGAVTVVDLLDYKNVNKFKTFRTITGFDTNGAGGIWYRSGLWMNTNAINSLSVVSNNLFGQYSVIALYGIKG